MSHRGDGRIYRPSKNPTVTIGITLTTSSPTLEAESSTPFYLILTARILTSPRPSSPITLATHWTPFHRIPNKAFTDIICVNPSSPTEKAIKIFQPNWPHFIFESSNLKDELEFVTIPSADPTRGFSLPSTREFIFRHEIPRDRVSAAGVEKGERFRVAFTNKCLGTAWWMFGDLEEMKDVRFVRSGLYSGFPEGEREGTDEEGKWLKGEDPNELAFVIETENEGAVEFEII